MTPGARFFDISEAELKALSGVFTTNAAPPAAADAVPTSVDTLATAAETASAVAAPRMTAGADVVNRAYLQGKLHLLLDSVKEDLRDTTAQAAADRFRDALPLRRPLTPPNGPVPIPEWLDRFGLYWVRTCSIALPGAHLGSGFLIGPDLVVTSFHVLDGFLTPDVAADIRVIFDQQLDSHGFLSTPTDIVSLSKAQPVLALSALDIVVVRTASQPGLTQLPGGLRSWVPVPQKPFPIVPNMYVSGIHRPTPEQLLFSPGFVCRKDDGTHVEYTLTMKPGSSGAPVFTANWELLAIHNMDIPADEISPHCTAGILSWHLAAALREVYAVELPEHAPIPLRID
jgi:hypothetical protein